MDLSRRHVLKLGGVALAATAVRPSHARGQTPKRGGTLALRTRGPPDLDPFRTLSHKTPIALSFTHRRPPQHNAGPNAAPGSLASGGSQSQPGSRPTEPTWAL